MFMKSGDRGREGEANCHDDWRVENFAGFRHFCTYYRPAGVLPQAPWTVVGDCNSCDRHWPFSLRKVTGTPIFRKVPSGSDGSARASAGAGDILEGAVFAMTGW